MMKKTTLAAAIALTAGLFASSAMAVLSPAEVDGGTVNFNGNMIAAACQVDTATKDQTIALGTWDLATLKQSVTKVDNFDMLGDPVPFSIKLVNCDTQVSQNVEVTFNAAGSAGRRIPNSSPDAAKTNLDLVIVQDNLSVMTDGSAPSAVKALADGTVNLDYVAYYQSFDIPNVTAGKSLYSTTYKLKYQ